jgi:hypothetical protein
MELVSDFQLLDSIIFILRSNFCKFHTLLSNFWYKVDTTGRVVQPRAGNYRFSFCFSFLLSRDPKNIEVEVSHGFEIELICNLYYLSDFILPLLLISFYFGNFI